MIGSGAGFDWAMEDGERALAESSGLSQRHVPWLTNLTVLSVIIRLPFFFPPSFAIFFPSTKAFVLLSQKKKNNNNKFVLQLLLILEKK